MVDVYIAMVTHYHAIMHADLGESVNSKSQAQVHVYGTVSRQPFEGMDARTNQTVLRATELCRVYDGVVGKC